VHLRDYLLNNNLTAVHFLNRTHRISTNRPAATNGEQQTPTNRAFTWGHGRAPLCPKCPISPEFFIYPFLWEKKICVYSMLCPILDKEYVKNMCIFFFSVRLYIAKSLDSLDIFSSFMLASSVRLSLAVSLCLALLVRLGGRLSLSLGGCRRR